jgi:uncharacterized protein (TIGR04376 family)
MGLFDDFNRFLEERLDEFMRNNPHLELMALEDKLQDQEEETLKIMTDLKRQETQVQDEILRLAQEIQQWHARIEKARAAGRMDLAEPAQEHEAALLRQGNQCWGQMEVIKERMRQTQELQAKIQARRKEVQAQINQVQASRASAQATSSATNWNTVGWNQGLNESSRNTQDLEKKFQRWEAEQELEQMKRNMGQ